MLIDISDLPPETAAYEERDPRYKPTKWACSDDIGNDDCGIKVELTVWDYIWAIRQLNKRRAANGGSNNARNTPFDGY